MADIREYKNGDEEKILSLFSQIFDADRDKEYWRWQFTENPTGQPIIVVAEDNSDIVGQCTLLPTYMEVNGEEVLSGKSIDTMVKKEYRNQKLHIEMANKSYDLGVKKGIKFRVGFPSQVALRGLLGSIGASFVTDATIFMRPYKMDNFILSLTNSKFVSKLLSIPILLFLKLIFKESKIRIKEQYKFEEVEEFNEEFDKLWDKVKINSPIMSRRDSEFLNWRIKDHPSIDYKTIAAYSNGELVGYMVLRIEVRKLKDKYETNIGSIVDMIGIKEEVIAALYYKAKEFFKKENTDFVVVWVTDSMKYRSLFVKLGFIKSKSNIPFVVKDLTDNKELEEIITKEENWYLMPIESDLY